MFNPIKNRKGFTLKKFKKKKYEQQKLRGLVNDEVIQIHLKLTHIDNIITILGNNHPSTPEYKQQRRTLSDHLVELTSSVMTKQELIDSIDPTPFGREYLGPMTKTQIKELIQENYWEQEVSV